MGAINPFWMWAALAGAGIAVPIIIHLLYRKHRKQTDWAAMELLRRALVVRSGQVKLEDYLILFLRCLALLLLALALLRPIMNQKSASLIGGKRAGIVVAIDASFSMNHGEHSRFERALKKAREVLGTAREGDSVTLVLMSNRPEVLMRGADYDQGRFSDLLDGLGSCPPYRLSLAQNLEQLEELVGELRTASKECILITDSQELDWAELGADARASFERLTENANVFVVPVGTAGDENFSVESLRYSSGALRPDGDALFTATVRNEGRHPADGGTVEFYLDGKLSRRVAVGTIDAGESRGVEFYPPFDKAGEIRLMAKLSNDDLNDDNVRHAVAKIRSGISLLCVDGSSTSENNTNRTGSFYAVRALRLKDRGVENPVQVTQIEAPDLALESLRDFDAVILANVADLPPEMIGRLHKFVSRGGGLFIATGSRVIAADYNARFGTGEDGLLPAELAEAIQIEDDQPGWSIGPVNSGHLLAGLVSRLNPKLLDTARFGKVTKSAPVHGAETILTVAELDAPLLLSKEIGSGAVWLLTSSLDQSWNNLPVHPLFPMLLQQAVTNFTSNPDELDLTVGLSTGLNVTDREVGDSVSLIDPSGQASELRVTQSGDRPVAAVDLGAVGFYEITTGSEADPQNVVVASNTDATESDVKVVDRSVLTSQLDPLGVEVIARDGALDSTLRNARRGRELSTLLLWLAVIVFVLQSILARHFTNKMDKDESADLTATLQMNKVAAARRT